MTDHIKFFKFHDHFRATINGVGLKCKACDKIIEHDIDPNTNEIRERRHRCNVSDHPYYKPGLASADEIIQEIQGEWNDEDWDDDLDPEGIEDEVGARIARGFDLQGYGEMNEAYTAFSERW